MQNGAAMTIKVDVVANWNGLPEPGFEGEGPFELTPEGILEFFRRGRDVAIVHSPQRQPTRRQRGAGSPAVPDKVVVWLDSRGGQFRVR